MFPLSLALVAFAAGVVLPQWQPVLPPVVPWLGVALAGAIAGTALYALRRKLPVAHIAAPVRDRRSAPLRSSQPHR